MAKTKIDFPDGTTFGIWFPVNESGKWRIKRMATLPSGERKPQRLNRENYKHIANQYEAILKHCDRLNFGVNMSKRREVEIVSAFIPEHILGGFQDELFAAIPDKSYAKYLFKKALKEYFLDFFINHIRIPDPNLWPQHQTEWGQALLSKGPKRVFDSPTSVRTITLVIQTANRFLKYLHQQLPMQYPLIQLSPISKAVLKLYGANRNSEPIGKYISDADWKALQKHLTPELKPFIHLMYFYGLRRAESLGFQSTDAVKKLHLKVSHQLVSFNNGNATYSPLKNREQRDTPHWYSTPANAYKLISQTQTKKMHPDTLSSTWDTLMKGLGWEYHLHDFRRTFITRALRDHNPRDVQLAVGHSDLRTTMQYAQDDRNLGDEIWTPDSAS